MQRLLFRRRPDHHRCKWLPLGSRTALGLSVSLLVLLLTLQTPGSGIAQVVARQGVEDPNRIQSFRSPMVLEYPASELLQSESGTAWRFKEIERFDCDGVHFEYVSLARSGKVKNGLSLQIEGRLAVGPSFDREAKVIVEVLADGKPIGQGVKEKIDAEERKTKPFRFTFRLTPESSRLLEESSNTVLRVTLFVWES